VTPWRALTWAGSVGSALLTLHTLANLRTLRTPLAEPPEVTERVSVLIPARDEAAQIEACLARVLTQVGVADLQVIVLDDGSSDGTGDLARSFAEDDARLTVIEGTEPPAGWLGKPHACAELAAAADGDVLVFVDADVRLAPQAVAAAVTLLRSAPLDLVSPYPRQLAGSIAERLVQPLLQWSWLTTLPLALAERSPDPTLTAANGQFLTVDARAYRRVGGHAAVRESVLEDIGLARAIKARGGTATVADGTTLATCRMYDGWPALRDGYAKSLWAAFGSRRAAVAVTGAMSVLYVVPAVAALRGSRVGLAGYTAAVLGRYFVAERTGGRSLPDSLAHPASIVILDWLTVHSWVMRRRGELRWKGRTIGGTAR
jgi:hypothetical protein